MSTAPRLSRSISGKVAIVTGAASGMGRATAELFAAQGAKIALLDRDEAKLDVVVSGIVNDGGVAIGVTADLSELDRVRDHVQAARDALGPIDILVNNAGVPSGATFDAEGFDNIWRATFTVNLDAQVAMVRACLADLRRAGSGRIVNIASTEALSAAPRTAPYTASKHAVVGLTRSLAVELGRHGVTANCVCPGPIRTAMTDAIPDESKERFARRRVPIGRYGNPEEVAHVTLSLVLPASSYLNGAIIPVDGGMTANAR